MPTAKRREPVSPHPDASGPGCRWRPTADAEAVIRRTGVSGLAICTLMLLVQLITTMRPDPRGTIDRGDSAQVASAVMGLAPIFSTVFIFFAVGLGCHLGEIMGTGCAALLRVSPSKPEPEPHDQAPGPDKAHSAPHPQSGMAAVRERPGRALLDEEAQALCGANAWRGY